MAELLLGFALGLAGLWLASRQGDDAAAGFALTNQIVGTAALLFRVVNMGVSVVITQAVGAQNLDRARATALAAMGATTRVGLLLAVVMGACAPYLLLALGTSASVQDASTELLQWLALGLVLDGYCAGLGSSLRANLHGRDAMWVSLAMHASHLLGSWLLMPVMGLAGFGAALLLSRALAMALQLKLWRLRLGIQLRLSDWWVWRGDLLRSALAIGLPGAAETIAYRIAMLAAVTVVAGLGTASLAAHSYAQQLITAVVLATVAMGFACEIVVGHLIGSGHFREANRLVRRVFWLAMALSMGIAVVNATFAPWTMRQFTSDPTVLEAGVPLVWLAVMLEPGRTCNVVVINALRGAGDARFPVLVGSLSMLVVMAGGSWLLGVGLGWGLKGVWLALIADETLRGAIMAWRWQSLGWTGHARRLRRQLAPPTQALA